MMVEIVVGLFVMGALGVASYAIHRHRGRAKWAGIHEEQLEKLKQLKRLRWCEKRFATAVPVTTGTDLRTRLGKGEDGIGAEMWRETK